MSERWREIAERQHGSDYATTYARNFRTLAQRGRDTHGEAALVQRHWPRHARVLDAGCGTGRIAVRLAQEGYAVVACDADASMIAVARAEHPELAWQVVDLAQSTPAGEFDLVLLAGNVVPLLDDGTLPQVCARIVSALAPGGAVVAGFGLDTAHLPTGCPVTPLADVDAAFAAVGLASAQRWATWDEDAWEPGGGYVVAVWVKMSA